MPADTAQKRLSAMNMSDPWRGVGVLPDGAISQGDRQAAMFWYSGILFVAGGPTWTTIGPAVFYNSGTYLFEAYIRATTGTAYARLIDNLSNTLGQVSTTSSTFSRVRSGSLSLVQGREYRTQVGKAGADAGEILGARLVPP